MVPKRLGTGIKIYKWFRHDGEELKFENGSGTMGNGNRKWFRNDGLREFQLESVSGMMGNGERESKI